VTVRRVQLPHRRSQKISLALSFLSLIPSLFPSLSLSLSLSLGFVRTSSCRDTPISASCSNIGYSRARVRTTEREKERRERERERERERRGGELLPPAARARVGDGAPRSKARRPRRRHYSAHAIIVGYGRTFSLSLSLSFSLYPSLSFSISPRMPPRRRCHPLFPRDACSPHDRDPRVPRECRRDSLWEG